MKIFYITFKYQQHDQSEAPHNSRPTVETSIKNLANNTKQSMLQ